MTSAYYNFFTVIFVMKLPSFVKTAYLLNMDTSEGLLFLFYIFGVGWDWVHLVRRPLFRPKYLEKICPSAPLSTKNST
jgi:hypothetical protein